MISAILMLSETANKEWVAASATGFDHAEQLDFNHGASDSEITRRRMS